ncbi:MAG: phage terminase large subunit [Planctomycetes bacterium]|nr:phage terminase large subunit [Planctomycetota bacterium]
MSVDPGSLAQVRADLQAQARSRAQTSLRAFGRLYLRHHLEKPPSRMHQDLYQRLEALTERPGARLAIAAPRNSAKSTLVTLLYPLWAICHRRYRFIVLLSDTADKAAEFLDHIKHELVNNALLAEDYPEACEVCGKYPRAPRWRSNEIITANGVKVTAQGVSQNLRGRRHLETRPDLIIVDDAETRENTATAEARAKLEEWFNKSILKAGTKETRVLVVGTIQHYDSLLARLTDTVKSPLWESRIYRSVIAWSAHPELWQVWSSLLHRREERDGDTGLEAARRYFEEHREAMLEGTEVLWPESEDYHALMLMRESEGPASFDSEKQNQPVNPADCLFLEEEFHFWDDRWESAAELIAALGKHATWVGACDPSLGKAGRHADDSAIITLLRDDSTGILYVIDADLARRKPDVIIESVLTYHRLRGYAKFAFEANQFQVLLADELARRSNVEGLYLPVEPVVHSSDKLARIQSLQPLVRSGTLQFSRRHAALLEQMRLFPKAAHDDGPDALEMAVAAARALACGKIEAIFGPRFDERALPW